jgi:iron complex outermembrane receptor protein
MRWVGDYVVNNANSVSNWAYTVFDVTLGWDGEWRGVRVQPFLGIENLFDERYNMSTISNALGNRFFEPAPGREFYIGVTLGAGLF